MKNEKIVATYEKVTPDDAAKKRMLENIMQTCSKQTSRKVDFMKKRLSWKIVAPVAAILVLAMVLGIPQLMNPGKPASLPSKGNIKFSFASELPPPDINAIVAIFTEDEVFTMFETDVYTGTVKSVQNIQVEYAGMTEVKGIATITVAKTLRGGKAAGETVTVMLPGPVADGQIQGPDMSVYPAMKAGDKGVFMLVKHDENAYWDDGETRILFSEVAEYSVIDTQRFIFLETEDGLEFARDTFPALATATTLDEVETYVAGKING